MGRVPVKGQCRPLRLHGEAGCNRDQQRGNYGDDVQELRYRKVNRLTGEEDRMRIGQVGGVAVAQYEKRAEEDHERERREYRERSPLEAEALPKDGCEAERTEPEQVNPVGDGGAAADKD